MQKFLIQASKPFDSLPVLVIMYIYNVIIYSYIMLLYIYTHHTHQEDHPQDAPPACRQPLQGHLSKRGGTLSGRQQSAQHNGFVAVVRRRKWEPIQQQLAAAEELMAWHLTMVTMGKNGHEKMAVDMTGNTEINN